MGRFRAGTFCIGSFCLGTFCLGTFCRSTGFWRQKEFLNGNYLAQSRARKQNLERLEPLSYKDTKYVIKPFLPCL